MDSLIPVVKDQAQEPPLNIKTKPPSAMKALSIIAAAHSDPGKVRQVNEDSVFTFVRPAQSGDALGLLLVADGIGGHKAGDIASKLAATTVFESLSWFLEKDQTEDTRPLNTSPELDPNNFIEKRLRRAVENANLKIFEYAQNNQEKAGNMGTTITAALIWKHSMVIAHVGDSRGYLFRNGILHQLTEDHSFVGQLIRRGQLPYDAYYEHPRRNVITRALGQFPDVQIDLRTDVLQAGDKLLLCSDGLWEMIRDPRITDYLNQSDDLNAIASAMIQEAIANGGPDNISLVLGHVNHTNPHDS
nr:Stp1/IreP family PP2C-type Ser/Thr phosphatase [Anaerolineales bacterium]